MDAAVWRGARSRLAELRETFSRPSETTEHLSVEIAETGVPRSVRARGAVVIQRPSALRMILLGPGGTTALDLWVFGEQFRFAVPALGVVHRGSVQASTKERGLPVEFLRWWLLRPFEGELFWAERNPHRERMYLRDAEHIVRVDVAADGSLSVHRARSGKGSALPIDGETLVSDGRPCGRAEYRKERTGLMVSVLCESAEPGVANPRAFADPDKDAPRKDAGPL